MSKVCILGSGYAGLITAKVLLEDGFDVEIVTGDATPGGVWCRERIYQDLRINKCVILLSFVTNTQLTHFIRWEQCSWGI